MKLYNEKKYNIEFYTYTTRKELHGTRVYKKVIKQKYYTIKNVDNKDLSKKVIEFQRQQRLTNLIYEFIRV